MNWFKVAEFAGNLDLGELHRYLTQRGLVHRFVENHSVQELWIADERLVADVQAVITAWQQGVLPAADAQSEESDDLSRQNASLNESQGLHGSRSTSAFDQALRGYPVTLLIIALGIIGYLIASLFIQTGWLSVFTFQHFQPTLGGLLFEPVLQAYQRGEFWRLLTPTFLHFSLLHIVFNGLWIWEFGRRLELYFSRKTYLLLFFGTAVGANLVQYLSASDVPFGGLSGVVYGYLGILFVARRIAPHPVLSVPSGIFVFMLLWLALGVFGVIDFFLPGSAAVGNGAHLGGLLFGLILGYIFLHKRRS